MNSDEPALLEKQYRTRLSVKSEDGLRHRPTTNNSTLNQTRDQQDYNDESRSRKLEVMRRKYMPDGEPSPSQLIDLALSTHNVSFLVQLMQDEAAFADLSEDNVARLLGFIFLKLNLQRGRFRLDTERKRRPASISTDDG